MGGLRTDREEAAAAMDVELRAAGVPLVDAVEDHIRGLLRWKDVNECRVRTVAPTVLATHQSSRIDQELIGSVAMISEDLR